MMQLTIDETKCTRDGVCVSVCPVEIIEMTDNGPRLKPEAKQLCVSCGHCVAACPTGCLSHPAMTADECRPIVDGWRQNEDVVGNLLKSRRSIRRFKSDTVEKEVIAKILDIARYAPSGVNQQPVRWLAIWSPEIVHEMARCTIEWMREQVMEKTVLAHVFRMDNLVNAWDAGKDPICRNAPHCLVAYADKNNRTAQGACMIALAHAEIAALPFNIGSCWAGYLSIGLSSSPQLFSLTGLTPASVCHGALLIGYPAVDFKKIPTRKKARINWL